MSINGEIDYVFSYIREPPLAKIDIYRQIYTFHNWLASEEAAVIKACPDYNRQLMVTLRTYHDKAVSPFSPMMQLTCKLGGQILQNFVSRLSMLTVDCV